MCSLLFLLFVTTLGWAEADIKIYGGTPVNITEVPYFASLLYTCNNQHFCGASIVHPQFVVSAAHCMLDGFILGGCVRVGTDRISQGGQIYNKKKIFVHPSYNGALNGSDIAVIQLTQDIQFSAGVKPIQLFASHLPLPDGTSVMNVGFGQTETAYLSLVLLKVILPMVSNRVCQKSYSSRLTETMICAGGQPGKSSCMGDSGGPLVYNNQLLGIVSFVNGGCGIKGLPVVYTSIPAVKGFIEETIKNNS